MRFYTCKNLFPQTSSISIKLYKLTHGLFNYGYGSKNRKARKIKNFNKDMELNNKLYQLANEFVN